MPIAQLEQSFVAGTGVNESGDIPLPEGKLLFVSIQPRSAAHARPMVIVDHRTGTPALRNNVLLGVVQNSSPSIVLSRDLQLPVKSNDALRIGCFNPGLDAVTLTLIAYVEVAA